MELELSRVDYTIVGVTANNCMKMLPNVNPKDQQRVAVADNEGILQVFSVRKEEVQIHFKTLPGSKISSLQLAGANGTPNDKIFIASENEIRGYTKKGKLFLSFDSNLTEPITSMFVLGNDLFVCGKHIYNHYRDCKDVGSYLCGDRIVDVIALYTEKAHRLISLIACEGRMIRAIEHSRVTLSMEIESAPTTLHILEQDDIYYIIFGTVDGRVGMLDIDRMQSFSRWFVTNDHFPSGISCIHTHDLTGDGTKNLILGRNDGNVEVYAINVKDDMDKAILIFSYNCNESVTSIQCGFIGNSNSEEILVLTYTGRIFGLTSEVIEKNVNGDGSTGNHVYSTDTSQKIIKLKNEIEELQNKVTKEREKYQSLTQSFLDEISAMPVLSIKDSMILSRMEASYTLSIEVPMEIDNILLQSNVPVDLLDVEKNSAVVSYSEPDKKNNNYLLATYRCQVNTNRLEVKMRTIEGQYGLLQAYVTPLTQPKYCQLRQFEIRPLSLHLRIHNFDQNRQYNKLVVKGGFSLAEMHSWLCQCLPEIPEKPHASDRTELFFGSTFLDTLLKCSYWKGEAEFMSDNITTISILKEFISKEATKKKIKIDVTVLINDESINYLLKIIDPKLRTNVKLSNKISLLDALHELEVNDDQSISHLSSKYKSLLNNEKELRMEFSRQPFYLDRLYGVITDLFIDYYKLKGINIKSKVPKLLEILDKYKYEELLEHFRPDFQNIKH